MDQLAFKDNWQIYRIVDCRYEITGVTRIVILVATSGRYRRAALEGFKDVGRTRVIVFYPQEGVSVVQKQQMITQEGNNVYVAAVAGNFDDAQAGVKRIFADSSFATRLQAEGLKLSSANSINWGRLVPQIIYYISAYVDLLSKEEIKPGEKVNIVVPTGNFGNILAAYYASKMGLPVNKLICASNANNVLTEFINTGRYDRNREFHKTISPSMDILISSNLERLLYEVTDHDANRSQAMDAGELSRAIIRLTIVPHQISSKYSRRIIAQMKILWIPSARPGNNIVICLILILRVANVNEKYRNAIGDKSVAIVASTASPLNLATVLPAVYHLPCLMENLSLNC